MQRGIAFPFSVAACRQQLVCLRAIARSCAMVMALVLLAAGVMPAHAAVTLEFQVTLQQLNASGGRFDGATIFYEATLPSVGVVPTAPFEGPYIPTTTFIATISGSQAHDGVWDVVLEGTAGGFGSGALMRAGPTAGLEDQASMADDALNGLTMEINFEPPDFGLLRLGFGDMTISWDTSLDLLGGDAFNLSAADFTGLAVDGFEVIDGGNLYVANGPIVASARDGIASQAVPAPAIAALCGLWILFVAARRVASNSRWRRAAHATL